ncbi:protein MIGRI [Jeongeupia wiesaeckerbachi]
MLSPAWRSEAHRSARIAARVLLASAAIALAVHFLR